MDRERVAEECLRIEKRGGNVIAYLKGLGCVSPWGTWHRLQVEELGRKAGQIKDGKPTVKEEKKTVNKRKLTAEEKTKAMELYTNGGDPIEYLTSLGIEHAAHVWGGVKRFWPVAETPEAVPAKAETPETPVQLNPDYVAALEEEPLPFDQDTEDDPDAYDPFEYPPKVPVTRPLTYMDRLVTAIEDPEFGEFHRKGEWVDWETKDGEVISMTIPQWKLLIHSAIKYDFRILGVEL